MDSSGIGLILGRCAACEALGASVELVGLSERQAKLLSLAGARKVKNLSIV